MTLYSQEKLTCLMRSGLTVVWGCRMLTGSVLATFWGISRIFSAMKPWTAFSASTVPWIRHTRSVVPANTKSHLTDVDSLRSHKLLQSGHKDGTQRQRCKNNEKYIPKSTNERFPNIGIMWINLNNSYWHRTRNH